MSGKDLLTPKNLRKIQKIKSFLRTTQDFLKF